MCSRRHVELSLTLAKPNVKFSAIGFQCESDVIRTLRFLKTTVTSFFRPSLDFAETAKISELNLCFRLEGAMEECPP